MNIYFSDFTRHLVCLPYNINGLQSMASNLEIKPNWFHNNDTPHYDIPKGRRADIWRNTVVVSPKDILKIIRGEITSIEGVSRIYTKSEIDPNLFSALPIMLDLQLELILKYNCLISFKKMITALRKVLSKYDIVLSWDDLSDAGFIKYKGI